MVATEEHHDFAFRKGVQANATTFLPVNVALKDRDLGYSPNFGVRQARIFGVPMNGAKKQPDSVAEMADVERGGAMGRPRADELNVVV